MKVIIEEFQIETKNPIRIFGNKKTFVIHFEEKNNELLIERIHEHNDIIHLK